MGVFMIELREHQSTSLNLADKAWQTVKNVMLVLPTGAGKTVIMAEKALRCQRMNQGCVIFAHRDVLLEQISAALCRVGVWHNFYCSKPTVSNITTQNAKEFGNSYYRQTSLIIVASVDTFWRRDISQILPYITLWMIDEAHHVTTGSKWHRCIQKLDEMQHMKGLLVTATPLRADRKGLGRKYSGVTDEMIVGADMGTLIRRGLLCKYKIFIPHNLVDVSDVDITASGDYNRDQLAKKTDKSNITGEVIKEWMAHANGKQTIIFAVNIEHSNHVAEQFRAAGIRALSLSSEDTAAVRKECIDSFRRGVTKVLVNCDLFSEGFDVPAVECVVMLRKTLSYAMFKQQFGRCLRILKGKEFGILLDHVGNVEYFMSHYGLDYPHDDPAWTLADAPKKPSKRKSAKTLDAITCEKCRMYYVPEDAEQAKKCPNVDCGHIHGSGKPAETELPADQKYKPKKGTLRELQMDSSAFEQLKIEREKHDEDPEAVRRRMKFAGAPPMVYNSAAANHAKRRNAQTVLRSHIQAWCALYAKNTGAPVDVVQQQFQSTFGMNILEAHLLGESQAIELTRNINNYFTVPAL